MGIGEHSGKGDKPAEYAFGDIVVDTGAHRLLRGDRELEVEPKVFSVLVEFLTHPGQLLSRDYLLDAVWGHSCVTPSTLSRVISQLRRTVADDQEQPRYIQTVHSLGYRFIAPLINAEAEGAATLQFAPPIRGRLPVGPHALIAREHDIASLERLVVDSRLVTIAGAGGVGKTQVALEVARRITADFPDGVWLVDCTSLTDEEGLTHALAGMFEIHNPAGTDALMDSLIELLRERHVLLVLDNGERVAAHLGKVVEALLEDSVGPHVLVTSQQRLNCASESLYWLLPLDVPGSGEWPTDEDIVRLAQVPSVQLLLTRLRSFASGFSLTKANAAAVAEICRRVDGLPLALEIAAAHLRLLNPEQLLKRMKAHLLNLAEASPGRPAHHQTLHALIEWSFALLSKDEQYLLAGLSVFARGCTMTGANAVGKVFGLNEEQVLELLVGLVDKSLLVADTTMHPPSYHLLHSVKWFAREKLAESGEEPLVRDAHLAHFVQFTEYVDRAMNSDREHFWCDRVRREWSNLHVAFDYAMSRQDRVEHALTMSGNLCWYYRMCSHYDDAARRIDRALNAGQGQTRQRAKALIACGTVNHQSQLHEHAGPLLREGIGLATRLEIQSLAAAGQAVLSFELATCGDLVQAEACAASAQAFAEEQGDLWLRSMALLGHGISLALTERHAEAEACLGEAYGAVSVLGRDLFQRAYILKNRALQRFYLGQLRGAAGDWLADLDAFIGLRHWRGVAGCVEGAAYLSSERGEAQRAARFMAAAARVRKSSAAPLMPQWRKAQAIAEQRARRQLGKAFAQTQQEGYSARFEDIASEARATLEDVVSASAVRNPLDVYQADG
ncbi:ATP-binding protein [Dyella amyloliquefaciens]|uniref:ATP-binding protein n=1 Tax=Dyella amyloliquefaciens TaxID=1770545 RepID=UPI0013EE6D1C|nr:winged helix-turn-helix domain-containing protein [Dyella amyloliquefaciens]